MLMPSTTLPDAETTGLNAVLVQLDSKLFFQLQP